MSHKRDVFSYCLLVVAGPKLPFKETFLSMLSLHAIHEVTVPRQVILLFSEDFPLLYSGIFTYGMKLGLNV